MTRSISTLAGLFPTAMLVLSLPAQEQHKPKAVPETVEDLRRENDALRRQVQALRAQVEAKSEVAKKKRALENALRADKERAVAGAQKARPAPHDRLRLALRQVRPRVVRPQVKPKANAHERLAKLLEMARKKKEQQQGPEWTKYHTALRELTQAAMKLGKDPSPSADRKLVDAVEQALLDVRRALWNLERKTRREAGDASPKSDRRPDDATKPKTPSEPAARNLAPKRRA